MFGSKSGKKRRLRQEIEVIRSHGPLTAAELARAVGVNRNVVQRDLPEIEALGVYLQEDLDGRIALAAIKPRYQESDCCAGLFPFFAADCRTVLTHDDTND